jgi:hypothetical protein
MTAKRKRCEGAENAWEPMSPKLSSRKNVEFALLTT